MKKANMPPVTVVVSGLHAYTREKARSRAAATKCQLAQIAEHRYSWANDAWFACRHSSSARSLLGCHRIEQARPFARRILHLHTECLAIGVYRDYGPAGSCYGV
jgi:hypothetical protein